MNDDFVIKGNTFFLLNIRLREFKVFENKLLHELTRFKSDFDEKIFISLGNCE